MKKIVAIVVIVTLVIGVMFVTSALNKKSQTTQTQAAEPACPLRGNPQLIAGGKCQVATTDSTTLVCALIDPSKTPGDQLVAGQDPESGPLLVNWHISGGIGTVQLFKEPSISFNGSTQYRAVAYNWKDPGNCVKETDVSGNAVVTAFNASSGSNTQTGSDGVQNNNTNQGSQSRAFNPSNNQNESLKQSAINMMQAILDITNTSEVSNQPTTQPSTNSSPTVAPRTTELTPGAQPGPAPIDATPNTAYTAQAQACLKNKSVYEEASKITRIPWEILAGIHFVEGGCNSNKSLISGRIIGTNEPDLHGNCSSSNTGLGKPYPIAGSGCAFHSLLDTAIYGAHHLMGKIGRVPQNQQDYAKALGRYNGTGNRNCGRTPFASCPAPYEGYDHIYPMSKLDGPHQTMYLVYCADYTPCNPPKVYSRPGVLTIASILQTL